jgi:hypothetical protein
MQNVTLSDPPVDSLVMDGVMNLLSSCRGDSWGNLATGESS